MGTRITRTHVFINCAAFANYMGNWASTGEQRV